MLQKEMENKDVETRNARRLTRSKWCQTHLCILDLCKFYWVGKLALIHEFDYDLRRACSMRTRGVTKVTSSAFNMILYGNHNCTRKSANYRECNCCLSDEIKIWIWLHSRRIGTSKAEKVNSGVMREGYHVFSSIENWILKKRTYRHLLLLLLLLHCGYYPPLLSESRALPSRPQLMVSEGLAWVLLGEVLLLFKWCCELSICPATCYGLLKEASEKPTRGHSQSSLMTRMLPMNVLRSRRYGESPSRRDLLFIKSFEGSFSGEDRLYRREGGLSDEIKIWKWSGDS